MSEKRTETFDSLIDPSTTNFVLVKFINYLQVHTFAPWENYDEKKWKEFDKNNKISDEKWNYARLAFKKGSERYKEGIIAQIKKFISKYNLEDIFQQRSDSWILWKQLKELNIDLDEWKQLEEISWIEDSADKDSNGRNYWVIKHWLTKWLNRKSEGWKHENKWLKERLEELKKANAQEIIQGGNEIK